LTLRPSEQFTQGVSPEALAAQLRALGLQEGATVLVHASLRAIGPIQRGAQGLLQALQSVIGYAGTLVVPAFCWQTVDPACWNNPPPPERLADLQARVVPFSEDAEIDPSLGAFPRIIHRAPGALRSCHPSTSFVALGARAAELVAGQDINRAYGRDGPLGKLAELDGWVLLLGVDFRAATSVHCAEDEADLPYLLRDFPARLKVAPDSWVESTHDYNCSEGFNAVIPVLQARGQLRTGRVGAAHSYLVRQRHLVAAGLSLLADDQAALLCKRENCRECSRARRLLHGNACHDPGSHP